MTSALLVVALVVSLNFALWGTLGLVRVVDDRVHGRRRSPRHMRRPAAAVEAGDVALLIPAHDEELVLGRTLSSAAALVPVEDIYVVSDGSVDATEAIAREAGANVLRLAPCRGKASALAEGLAHFGITDRYEVVLFVDADTELSPDYLTRGLPQFADPDVVAVAGATATDWHRGGPLVARLLLAHRDRVYALTQLLQKFGQGWRRTNVVHIVPGAASMYRAEAVAHLEVDAPGLVIEDFNMTFEVHHKGLGRVAFDPGVRATTQDPDTLGDYTRQMRRWCLGFWQTVRRHGFWPSRFGLALSFSVFDLLLGSLFLVSIPVVLLGLGLHELVGGAFPAVGDEAAYLAGAYDPKLLLLAVVLPDYALTVLVAAVRRRPLYLVLGLGFLVLRVVDAATALYTLPLAWARRSSGRWVSPVRRPVTAGPAERRDLVDAAP